jgi:hypothetical protein
MTGERCPYCGNADLLQMGYYGRNNETVMRGGKAIVTSRMRCYKCSRDFKVVSDAGTILACLEMGETVDYGRLGL